MLNKQGPDKIDWTDYTWNPIGGCLHACPYCYMLRMEKRFPGTMQPKFRPDYLNDPAKLKNPSKIFVGSSGDMWGAWVSLAWKTIVLDAVVENKQHTFQFLTKNPLSYSEHILPENGWYGTTIDGREFTKGNDSFLCESVGSDRIKFISFEPLLSEVHPHDLKSVQWIIIGANSNRGATRPPKKWADILIDEARQHNIPVWVKNNYGYPETIKEFPAEG